MELIRVIDMEMEMEWTWSGHGVDMDVKYLFAHGSWRCSNFDAC